MNKDRGVGRNCEPNVHFESFYPSEKINEEGALGVDSGPVIVASIDGESSMKVDVQDGTEQAELLRNRTGKHDD